MGTAADRSQYFDFKKGGDYQYDSIFLKFFLPHDFRLSEPILIFFLTRKLALSYFNLEQFLKSDYFLEKIVCLWMVVANEVMLW